MRKLHLFINAKNRFNTFIFRERLRARYRARFSHETGSLSSY